MDRSENEYKNLV